LQDVVEVVQAKLVLIIHLVVRVMVAQVFLLLLQVLL
jgi:hypothetical protein